jgi:hypothetical protein
MKESLAFMKGSCHGSLFRQRGEAERIFSKCFRIKAWEVGARYVMRGPRNNPTHSSSRRPA